MSEIDYRAEAERYAKFARELWRTDSAEGAQAAIVSQAHAMLAASAATRESLAEYLTLRTAVRDYLRALDANGSAVVGDLRRLV